MTSQAHIQIPTLEEYVLVSYQQMQVECYCQTEGWIGSCRHPSHR